MESSEIRDSHTRYLAVLSSSYPRSQPISHSLCLLMQLMLEELLELHGR